MKTGSFSWRYFFLTSRWDQLWLPAGFWALFAILVGIFQTDRRGMDLAGGFLGVALPLIAGILSAYAFLEDPALELHFSTPTPAWQSLARRLGLVFVVVAAAAVSFQVLVWFVGVDLSHLGGLVGRQLAWLIPSLALMGLGSCGAFALAQSTGGALLVGMVWIVQIILHGWFPAQDAARPFFLFMRVFAADHPGLALNQVVLTVLGFGLLLAAWALLKKPERYLD